jgi:hypothetical protein
MFMNTRDPLGYYAVLELQHDAGEEQIKAAYRRRAMVLHPDRNPGRDTTEQFQALNEAFNALSDPAARAAYAAGAAAMSTPPSTEQPLPEPIKCSSCAKVSAQPRVVVYRSVRSFLLVTLRKPVTGVFCSECAQKRALKASATTWLLGWWGLPWGPVYSVQALLENMFGGSQPALENARLLVYQAYCFHTSGRHDIAFAIAQDALKFCARIKPTSRQAALVSERDDLVRRLEAFIAKERPTGAARLKNSWKIANRFFVYHAAAMGVVVAAITSAIVYAPVHERVSPKGPMPYSSQALAAPVVNAPAASVAQLQPQQAAFVRPKVAPNGKPWPKVAGYLDGEPQTKAAGHSEITIDNGQNDADVFVKLVALSGDVARPARQVFIPANGKFTMKRIDAGLYDIRYEDLMTGSRSRSDGMTLTETADARGIRYSVMTLTLQRVRNGNMAIHDLAAEEF